MAHCAVLGSQILVPCEVDFNVTPSRSFDTVFSQIDDDSVTGPLSVGSSSSTTSQPITSYSSTKFTYETPERVSPAAPLLFAITLFLF